MRENDIDSEEYEGSREPLISAENSSGSQSTLARARFKEWENIYMASLIVAGILIGTANRVCFKLMQNSSRNYGYFTSFLTTFIYIPTSIVALIPQFCRSYFGSGRLSTESSESMDIKSTIAEVSQWQYVKIAALDALSGVLILIGGVHVSGPMQNLLSQGLVPVTMLVSLVLFRDMGCVSCRNFKNLAKRAPLVCRHEHHLVKCTEGQCHAKLLITIKNSHTPKIFDSRNMPSLDRFLHSQLIEDVELVRLYSSERSWFKHMVEFYSTSQYLGAFVIILGLIISVLGRFTGSAIRPDDLSLWRMDRTVLWDAVYFSATFPAALSAVYKEIIFKKVDRINVWWLNGSVAIYQIIFGALYAPLAALLLGFNPSQIPENFMNGLWCYIKGYNKIRPPDCSLLSTCGYFNQLPCCDSCDGSIPKISAITSFHASNLYMVFNVAYNVLLVLMIKYGSATLMYISSTAVLPLGALVFSIPSVMGANTTKFTAWDSFSVAIVLLGVAVYRFSINSAEDLQQNQDSLTGRSPDLSNPSDWSTPVKQSGRRNTNIRLDFYSRLGLELPSPSHPGTSMQKSSNLSDLCSDEHHDPEESTFFASISPQ